MASLFYSICGSVVQQLKDAPVVQFFYAPPSIKRINSSKLEIRLFVIFTQSIIGVLVLTT